MKKFLISLILIFSIFSNTNSEYYDYGNINHKNTLYLYSILDKYFINIEEKYWIEKKEEILVNIFNKLEILKNDEIYLSKKDLLELTSFIIEDHLRKLIIKKYYFLIEKWELEKAFNIKILDFHNDNFDREKELENFKKIYNFNEEVEINIIQINKWLEYNMFCKVEIKYIESNKKEVYNVLMRVNPVIGMLPLWIKTISVNNPDIKSFFE